MTEKELKDKIVNAYHLGTFSHDSLDWQILRQGKVGGSQVGTIAGLNKWESPYTAWAKFTGQIDDTVPDSPAMEWGRRLEAVVIDKFADNHPELEVIRDVGTWQNRQREYQIANPDALFEKDGELGIIEIKTARYPDEWDTVPLYYLTQVQWYLSCLGLRRAYVAVLIGGSDYREFEIEADAFQQSADIELVETFLDHCEAGNPPAWDGSESTYETVRRIHPDIEDKEVELGELGVKLLEALNVETKAKSAALELKSQVLDTMGTAKKGLVDGQHLFSRQARGTGVPYLVMKRGQ